MELKKLLFIFCCILTFNGFGQSYNLTTTSGTYTDLVGSTSLNGTATWDDPEYLIPIGFNFQYFGQTLSTIYINDIGLGGFLSDSPSDSGIAAILQAYGADIMDRGYDFENDETPTGSLSTISYLLEGDNGTRILKIEWKNVGFFSDISINGAANSNATNFQLWLFENNNSFEIHFGPNTITDLNLAFEGDSGTSVILIEAFDYDNETIGENGALFLEGDPTSPTLTTVTQFLEDNFITLNGVIPNGTVYSFTNAPLSVDDFETAELKLFPNPASNVINISGLKQKEAYTIYDYTGRLITKGTFDIDYALNIENLSSGLYVLQFNIGHTIKFTKL
jgi:hypothetical protein